MAILAECAVCHRKQSAKNRLCSCGEDLVKQKRSKKVKYWIAYRVNGKQRRELVGYSVEEARDAEGKRRSQKRENRIFDIIPDAKMSFQELTDWYLGLPRPRPLKDTDRMRIGLANFNKTFGKMLVRDIKVTDLEIYQTQRIQQGHAASYIDQDVTYAATMINKAFLVDKVGPRTLKAFKALKSLQKTGANARTRTLSIAEYISLCKHAKAHLKPIIQTLMATGMRPGEVLNLRWDRIDLKDRFIRLKAEDTKTGQARSIPISKALVDVLKALLRNLHDDHVFLYFGEPIKRLQKSVKRACEDAGLVYGRQRVDGFILHDIRRTVKTNMLEAGVDKTYRDLILGHMLQGIDRHYVKPKEDRLTAAMARYSTWLKDKIRSVDQTVEQVAKSEL